MSKYFFNLEALKAHKFSGGTIVHVTSDDVPGLVNISFSGMKMQPGAGHEPIWHNNAHKIGYCLQGSAAITMRTPSSTEIITVQKGDMFFIPKGYVHNIVSTAQEETVIKCAYDHVKPETMTLTNAVHSLNDEVFTATFKTPQGFVGGLKRAKDPLAILLSPREVHSPSQNRYKFNIGGSTKTILTKGGYLQVGTKPNLPVLEGLGILGFGLNPGGVVEPHWHTNAGELVYIVKGHTKITLLSPNGKVEVLDVKGGQGAFAPASHFHNILNVGKDEVEVIAFFSHAEPDYIGISEVVGSYSNEVLGQIFNVDPNYFESLKKTEEPLVIVPV